MSSIKLDLSQFKHKSSDKDSTTLSHEKHGHEIRLAHKALSEENRKQLEALAMAAKKSSDKENKSGTIHTDNSAKGVEQAKEIKKQGAAEHGATIVKHDKEESKDIGEVKGPKGEKPEVFAEGGEVQQVPEALKPTDESQSPVQEINSAPDNKPVLVEDPSLARKREIYNKVANVGMTVDPYTGKMMSSPNAFGPNGEEPQNFNPKLWSEAEQSYSEEEAQNAANAAQAQQKAIEINQARTQAGLAPIPVPNVPQGPQIPGSPAAPAQQKPDELPKQVVQETAKKEAQATGMPSMDNVEGMMQHGFQNKMAGIQQGAQAQGALGEAQAEIINKQAQAQQDAQIAYKKTYDALERERQAHIKDIENAHIDPNRYWTGDANGNGSHSKLMAGIGMILAGFNPTNNPNAAINFLKTQMDMNLEAQKQNLGAKQNLLTANLRQFGNLKDATDMTRLMQNDIMQKELMSAAAKAQSPQAKAAAMQAAGQLQMEYAPIAQNFAMRRAMMHLADGGGSGKNPGDTAAAEQMIAYARMTNPEMAKEMESRLIPGVGMAKIPVSEAARKEIIEKQSLNNAAQDLMQYSKKHSNLIPGTPDYNFGVAKALAVQQKIREGLLGTVFRESEKPLLEKFVNENPAGALKSFSTQPKLKAIIDSNIMGLNAVKQGYGLPTQQTQQQANDPRAAMAWAKANPKDPRAAKILKLIGQQGK